MILTYQQLKEATESFVKHIDYDQWKDLFLYPEDECSVAQAEYVVSVLEGILNDLGIETEGESE